MTGPSFDGLVFYIAVTERYRIWFLKRIMYRNSSAEQRSSPRKRKSVNKKEQAAVGQPVLVCRKSTLVRNRAFTSLPLTREVGSLASSEGEITKRYRNTPMMDSSRIISIITQGIESCVCKQLYSCVISPLAFFH